MLDDRDRYQHRGRFLAGALPAWAPPGLLVPSEYDGAGMTMVEAGIVPRRNSAPGYNPGPWLSTAVAATRALIRDFEGGRQRGGATFPTRDPRTVPTDRSGGPRSDGDRQERRYQAGDGVVLDGRGRQRCGMSPPPT